MTRLVIVPVALDAEIYRLLDEAIAKCPEAAESRNELHDQLVGYFDEHGRLPDASELAIERVK